MGWLSAPLCGVCHTTCSSSSFLTAAPVSFTPLYSSASHFRSIAPCSQLNICFRALHPAALHKTFYGLDAQSLSQAKTQLTWFHYTRSSLLHFSKVQSTRCLFYFARRLAIACVQGLCWHEARLMQACHTNPLHCAPIMACRPFYWSPQSLALAVRLRSFVPHSLRRPLNGSQALQPRQVCGAPELLLAAGAFTVLSQKQKAIKSTAFIKINFDDFILQQHLHQVHLTLLIQYHYPFPKMNHTFHLCQ